MPGRLGEQVELPTHPSPSLAPSPTEPVLSQINATGSRVHLQGKAKKGLHTPQAAESPQLPTAPH